MYIKIVLVSMVRNCCLNGMFTFTTIFLFGSLCYTFYYLYTNFNRIVYKIVEVYTEALIIAKGTSTPSNNFECTFKHQGSFEYLSYDFRGRKWMIPRDFNCHVISGKDEFMLDLIGKYLQTMPYQKSVVSYSADRLFPNISDANAVYEIKTSLGEKEEIRERKFSIREQLSALMGIHGDFHYHYRMIYRTDPCDLWNIVGENRDRNTFYGNMTKKHIQIIFCNGKTVNIPPNANFYLYLLRSLRDNENETENEDENLCISEPMENENLETPCISEDDEDYEAEKDENEEEKNGENGSEE